MFKVSWYDVIALLYLGRQLPVMTFDVNYSPLARPLTTLCINVLLCIRHYYYYTYIIDDIS